MSTKFKTVSYIAAFLAFCMLLVAPVSAQPAASSSPPSLSTQEITRKVDEYMNAAIRINRFSGAVLLARDGQPIVSRGYGMANLEHAVPNTPQTVFRVGSVTKQFTGMAVVLLQERGKLSVNDPICKYLTDCPAAWQPITIKNLLTHTAGIPNYTEFPDFMKTAAVDTTSAELTSRFRDKPLQFALGEKYAYSNSGYYLLGTIIERASGKSYADFLQENIFAPLGMKDTGYDNPVRIINHRASGYARTTDGFINAAPISMSTAYAAGALYSTVGDLLLWDQALYTEKLVSRKSLDEAFTPFKSNYGYGWSIGKRHDRPVIAHGGGIFGFSAYIARYPADRVTVVVLSNVEGAPSGEIANSLSAIVFGAKYEIPSERKEVQVAAKTLEKYVGQYQLTPQLVLNVTLEDGKLLAQISTQPKLELFAESETVFFFKVVNAQVTFVVNAQGEVTGIVFRQGGSEIPAKKI
ncbi:MAG TPA: serine hydrolase [Pyrinomonadaceae bacterium]|nr:serine hydrolase [Pyrinomonadaceae bacterium]